MTSGYGSVIPNPVGDESHPLTRALGEKVGHYVEQYVEAMEKVKLKQGLKIVMSISGEGNGYLQESLFWKLFKEDRPLCSIVMRTASDVSLYHAISINWFDQALFMRSNLCLTFVIELLAVLKLPSGPNRPLPYLLTLVPPLILSLLDLFFKALDFTGTYGAVAFVMTVWNQILSEYVSVLGGGSVRRCVLHTTGQGVSLKVRTEPPCTKAKTGASKTANTGRLRDIEDLIHHFLIIVLRALNAPEGWMAVKTAGDQILVVATTSDQVDLD
ncbi:hypothetical protein P3L10_009491 [Capsicum annuum]